MLYSWRRQSQRCICSGGRQRRREYWRRASRSTASRIVAVARRRWPSRRFVAPPVTRTMEPKESTLRRSRFRRDPVVRGDKLFSRRPLLFCVVTNTDRCHCGTSVWMQSCRRNAPTVSSPASYRWSGIARTVAQTSAGRVRLSQVRRRPAAVVVRTIAEVGVDTNRHP